MNEAEAQASRAELAKTHNAGRFGKSDKPSWPFCWTNT